LCSGSGRRIVKAALAPDTQRVRQLGSREKAVSTDTFLDPYFRKAKPNQVVAIMRGTATQFLPIAAQNTFTIVRKLLPKNTVWDPCDMTSGSFGPKDW
jgi:hypothetical protein